MRSEHLEMSRDDYDMLPRRWGWKYEYMDGCAVITPRDYYVSLRAEVTRRDVIIPDDDELHLQPFAMNTANPFDEQRLVSAFVDAFADSVEFCDGEYADIEAGAWKSVNGFVTGKRGTPHPASRVALVPAQHFPVVGAAFVTANGDDVALDLLLVRPRWQRCGLGTALVAAVINELQGAGVTSLRSSYHIANEASAAWHTRFGFVEEADLFVAKLRWRAAQHELRRVQQMASAEVKDLQGLEAECRDLKAQVAGLEGRAERDGYEAVMPVLRYA